MKHQTFYYKDPLTDEFAGDNITPKVIDNNYRYIRNSFFGRCLHIFWYRIVAYPLAKLYSLCAFRHKIVNKELLKPYKKRGYFIYGNHTHFMCDALFPTLVNSPKETVVIVHPNNVSMPILGRITPYLGALPLPDTKEATKNFTKAIDYSYHRNKSIMIYPEAHIWPYYTDIRPFTDSSFRYPVQYESPVFAMTNTYQRRRHGLKPKIITYIDGPFFPDTSLSVKENRAQLRNQVYNAMKLRAANNNIEINQFLPARQAATERSN